MCQGKNDRVLPGAVMKFMVEPIRLIKYRGRGYRVSTKPDVITRNDLLKASGSIVT